MTCDILKKIFPNYEVKRWYRDEWLRNDKTGFQLELDFFIPELNIAIEYQGAQHFRPVRFGGVSEDISNNAFKIQQQRDLAKKKALIIQNIKLIEITYKDQLTEENIKQILIKNGVKL
jgi:hypothetical protein